MRLDFLPQRVILTFCHSRESMLIQSFIIAAGLQRGARNPVLSVTEYIQLKSKAVSTKRK
jgi:hypothetical protein